MLFHPRRRWEDFSHDVQEMRWALVAWMEALLDRPVTVYPGSASAIYPPDNWSKYKLIPFDNHESSPVLGRAEGVLVGIDLDEWNLATNPPADTCPDNVEWHDQPITVQVGSGSRTYRFAVLRTDRSWDQRLDCLRHLKNLIHHIECANTVA